MKYELKHKPLSIFSFSGLTDIVMLLLIFFLITSQFVVQTGVKVKLPASEQNEQVTAARMIVTITEEGNIYLGTDAVALDELPAKLAVAAESSQDKSLVIRADKSVQIDNVIKVIDAARAADVDKFTIETEKKTR